jgi:rod shape determining protein RodA
MESSFPTLRRRTGAFLRSLDPTLLAVLGALSVVGLITLYSAASDHPGNFGGQLRNFALAGAVLLLFASLSPAMLMRMAVPVYAIGMASLLAVLVAGVSVKGAQRWLEIGFTRVQPAEIMKLGVPLMLAWYFDRRAGTLRSLDFLVAFLIVLVPVGLIAKQPDLGTAVLVLAAGFFVIFFAGLPWRWLATLVVGALAAMPIAWTFMHDYQRNRILTLLDPMSDGKGFHTLQSMIAIGSGGVFGKGWMQGTQTHLEFIPERTTDFIFAVYSEEFGLVGNLVMVLLFLALVARALAIAGNAPTPFARLLAASIAMILFTYAFVNMAMVSGILPVVGVPLPLISYGGTALVTIGMACGILMTIQRNRKLVQS